MKKVILILGVFILSISMSIAAPNGRKDYFVGKWDVVCVGTPGGDSKMIVNLLRKNGKLQGTILREGQDATEISEIEEMKNAVKVYFRHKLFKVNLLLERKDDTHCTGSLMGQFSAKSVRLK